MDLTIKKTPLHDGDGYSYGGDTILTVGSKAINFGSCENEANYLYKCWYDNTIINGESIRTKKNSAEATAMLEELLQEIDKERNFYKVVTKLKDIKAQLERNMP